MTTPLYRRLLQPETLAALDALHAENARHGETTPDDDLDVLAGLIVAARAYQILQLGTFLGGSALVLADLARQNNPEQAKVLTVDPDPAMNAACHKYAQLAGLESVIETVDGFSTDPRLLAQFRGTEWQAIYLDTTHQYGQTVDEIQCLAPLCGPATLFLFHDASVHAANALDLGGRGGVRQAMREYCLMNPRWQTFTFEAPAFGKFGIGLMQKRVAA